ncbi:MAG: hypothetical protein JWO05_2249 [Gemmatimonadetes bacterium]|nr:hypothetical protein [Gemmatimonadota bacterium]
MRLLLIEDDRQSARLIRQLFVEDGDLLDVADTAEDGRVLARLNDYDAVILDLSLPDGSGIEILRELRREGRPTPVLVLTGRGAAGDMVSVLDSGADDYVVKPVQNDVLKARVRALVRRGGARRSETLQVGTLALNLLTHRAFVQTVEIPLTPREFGLLRELMLRAGEAISRTELLERVWDMHFDPGSNVVDANVARLRRKLERHSSSPEIETVRGVGFRMKGESTTVG